MKFRINSWIALGIGFLGWVIVYFLKDFDVTRFRFHFENYFLGAIPAGEEWRFAVNKMVRFLLNDIFSLLVIHGLFGKRKYIRMAFVVMLFGLFFLLPLYLFLAIYYQEKAFSLIVFLHRITLNPWLMILLIPAFYYQQQLKNSKEQP